jgi:uncharacterized phage-associated protein
MKPKFNEERATQLACLLLEKRGGKMSILKLMKLMYLIDREALVRWGWSITSDNYSAMPYGMVLSSTYSLVNEESTSSSYWKRFITAPQNYDVNLIEVPEYDELSKAELELIRELYNKWGHKNRWYLVNEVHHKLAEWKNPNGSSIPVTYQEVFVENKIPEEDFSIFLEELEDLALVEQIFEI